MSNSMFAITGIALENYRKFDRFEMSFDGDLTVLIGNNGAGKTSILDALSVAVGTMLVGIEDAVAPGIKQSDVRNMVRRQGSLAIPQAQYPSSIRARGIFSGKPLEWKRSLNTKKGTTTKGEAAVLVAEGKELQAQVSQGAEVVLPLVARYGANRFSRKETSTKRKVSNHKDSFLPSRTKAYAGALDAMVSEGATLTWLRNMTMWELQNGQESPELSCVKAAIKESLSSIPDLEVEGVRFDLSSQDIVVQYRDSHGIDRLDSVSAMSDGYRSAMLLFADIARRMAQLNPFLLGEAYRTPGIVLIDEVDLHLHPLWQASVIEDLTRAFPNVQFIVTTHSPTVVSSIRANNVRIMDPDGAHIPPASVYGRDVSSIMRAVMKAPARPSEVARMLEECSDLIDGEEYEQAENGLAELEKLIGADDPDLTGMRVQLALERL